MFAKAPRVLPYALVLAVSIGCRRETPPPSPPTATLAGEWTLVELNSQPAPPGAAGRCATLQFQADSARVAGFAGCNRFAAGYTLGGDSLRLAWRQ